MDMSHVKWVNQLKLKQTQACRSLNKLVSIMFLLNSESERCSVCLPFFVFVFLRQAAQTLGHINKRKSEAMISLTKLCSQNP